MPAHCRSLGVLESEAWRVTQQRWRPSSSFSSDLRLTRRHWSGSVATSTGARKNNLPPRLMLIPFYSCVKEAIVFSFSFSVLCLPLRFSRWAGRPDIYSRRSFISAASLFKQWAGSRDQCDGWADGSLKSPLQPGEIRGIFFLLWMDGTFKKSHRVSGDE